MRFTFILIALVFVPGLHLAQCPPPGFPDPGDNCGNPIICESLDGYCKTINSNNLPRTFPCCAGWQLNNDEWFGFFAGSTTITLEITPSNCDPGAQQGLQAAIYGNCPASPPPGGWCTDNLMDAQCACTEDVFQLTATDFIVGEVYWLVIDGCTGLVCDYEIHVLEGSTLGFAPDDPGMVTGPSPTCQGTATNYNVPPVNGATIYTWTLSPSNAGTLSDNNNNGDITVTWAAGFSGTATLCVKASNQCYSNPTESCITVEVLPKPTATLSGSGVLCTSSGNSVDLSVALTGDPEWTFVYAINGVPQPAVTTNSSPYTISVTQPGTYTLVSVASVDSDPDCAGTVSGNVVVNQVTLNLSSTTISAICGQSNGSIDLSVAGNGNAPYTYSWSSGQTTQDLSDIPPGAYTVTTTDNNNCTTTHTATVNDNIVNPSLTAIVTNNTSCVNHNGAIDLSVSPGGSYNYSWSNGATTQDLSSLSGGSYMVTVTQGVSCSASATYTVNDTPNAPNPVATSTNSTCDLPNGSINASISGGVAPYTFEWSNGATTEDLNNIIAGTYELTVTGANGCTNTVSVNVNNVNPAINLSAVIINNTICNGGNGSINLTVTPNGSYTYNWSNGATTEDLSALVPGNYTVTVSSGGSCTVEASYTVNDTPNLPNPTAVATPSTCDLENGSINASVSGGVSPYTFEWSNGETTEDIFDLLAGNYTLTVTGNNGCTKSVSVIVGNDNPSINLGATIVNNSSCNGGNGRINLTVTPSGNYTYSWSNGATTKDVSSLQSGTYTVSVSAGGSCTAEAPYTVNDAPNLPIPTAVATPSTCDLENGSINASVTGGVAPYTFEWSNGATTEDIDNLLAGNYTLTVTGSNGCTNTVSVLVTNTNPGITLTASIVNNTSCNGGNGSINLIVTPPNNYTYNWSNGATTEDLSNLPFGSYTVTVSAGGSCTNEEVFAVNNSANLPSPSAIPTPSTCGLDNGSINSSVSGGTAPYTYAWSNGATTEDLSNIPGGTYVLTVTDANDCSSVLSVDVINLSSNFSLNGVIVHNTSCSGGNGSINLIVTPAGNYTYNWSNGSTSEDLSGLAAGSYTVTISENSCSTQTTFVVNNAANLPIPTVVPTPATCNLNNGSIDASVTTGVPPYTFLWSNGATTEDLVNLPTGNYVLTVTAANGCTNTVSATINTSNAPTASIQTVSNVNCFGGNNGAATAMGSGGNGPYSYQWSNGTTTAAANNLIAGTYIVTITDASNCTASASVTITQPAPLLPNASATGETAFGANDGTATANPSGGTPAYNYSWSNGGTTQTIANLTPGAYTVSVTDTKGCITIQTVNVNAYGCSLMPSVSSTNVSCYGFSDGLASVTLTGAANPITYTWSNGATTQSVNNLPPGFYTVNILDGNNCQAMLSVVISEPPALLANASATDISAPGANDGTASAAPTGGTPGYQYLWSNGSSNQTISGLEPGSYTVSITDATGCSNVQTVTVSDYGCSLQATITATNLNCNGSNNGTASVSLSGASDPTTFVWSNGATSQTVSGLAAGTYTLTVGDANGCNVILSTTIQEPPTLLANASTTNLTDYGANDGTAKANPTGGTPGYTYVWSTGETTNKIIGLSPGAYTVTVTDANGCTKKQTVYVSNYNCALSAIVSLTHVRCNGGMDGKVTLEIIGGTTPYTYAWSNGATTQNIENLTAGAYGVTVEDAGQCYSVLSFNINQPAALQVSVYDLHHVPCPQDMTGSAAVSATGGIMPYAFFWSSGSPQNLSPGTYTVTVSDANACTKTATFSIVSTDSLAPQMTCPDDLEICAPGIVDYQKAFASDNCGLAASPSILSGPPSGSFMEIGEYSIVFQASDASGNTATCSFTISVNEQIQIVVDSFANDQNSQSVGLIWVSPVGGGGYTYAWSKDGQPYAVTEDLSGLGAGVYTLTLLDSNGCTATLAPVVISNVVGTDEPVSIGWIKLRPNPAQSYIQLEIKDLEVVAAMVLDIRGGLVNRIEPAALSGKIGIQHLPDATYFLKLITGNGGIVLLKFVKAGN